MECFSGLEIEDIFGVIVASTCGPRPVMNFMILAPGCKSLYSSSMDGLHFSP